ncbi:MAG: hypothetical protein ABR497_01550 [Kiritimatiellia bacterium]|nr:hypothetical protein [Lentisphaerota bacterium]
MTQQRPLYIPPAGHPHFTRQDHTADTPAPDTRRLAFICDTHVFGPIPPVQQRIIEWVNQRMLSLGVHNCILGGDITHHADREQALRFLKLLQHPPPGVITYLPGNNETLELELENQPRRDFQFVRGLTRLADWPGQVFALGAATAAQATAAVTALAAHRPATGHMLILSHFPPEHADNITMLDRPDLEIDWICGHKHQPGEHRCGNINVHVCAGLDPIKTRGTPPELLIGDWDGRTLRLHRLTAPSAIIKGPAHGRSPLGLAFKADAATVLRTALEHDCAALQLKPHGTDDLAAIDSLTTEFHRRHPGGLLSLHLPSPHPELSGSPATDWRPLLEKAQTLGFNDLTVHLPRVPAMLLYDEQRRLRDTTWAEKCLTEYLALAEQAIRSSATLSLENLYNKRSAAADGELLSSLPWHLAVLVDNLRTRLRHKGYSHAQARMVGILLDVGHAFRDPLGSKLHGLADWLTQLAPYIRLCHIHQVRPENGAMANHLPIENIYGPRINFSGLLPTIAEALGPDIPLLIEVRRLSGALTSLQVIRAWLAASFKNERNRLPKIGGAEASDRTR